MGYYASADLSYGAVLVRSEEDDAQEIFGLDDEQYELWSEDPEEYVSNLLLKANGFNVVPSSVRYGGEWSKADRNEYYAAEREALKTIGVSLQHHGDYMGDYGFYILEVNGLGAAGEYGPNAVDMSHMIVTSEQKAQLAWALDALNVRPVLPIGWFLSAQYR